MFFPDSFTGLIALSECVERWARRWVDGSRRGQPSRQRPAAIGIQASPHR